MKNSNKYLNLTSIITFALAFPLSVITTTSAVQAQSADYKSWSGAHCQAAFGGQEGDLKKQHYGIVNQSNYKRTVVCGLSRDNVVNTNGTKNAYAYVVTEHSSHSTTCWLRETSVSGGDIDVRQVSRTGTGYLYLDTQRSTRNGSRTLTCDLPRKARLTNIRIQEH